MPPTNLPKVHSPNVQRMADEDPNYLSAYNVCLQYESKFAADQAGLRYVRILGFLLLHAPHRGVRSEVTKCIHSCKDDSDIVILGKIFERYLILPFRKYRGRTPKTTDHPSRASFEVVKSQVKVDITEAPKNHLDAKNQALIRDNWRCVVTDMVHLDAPADVLSQLDPQQTILGYTECAHIIPAATFFGLNPKSEENYKLDNSAAILAVLKRFHYDISSFNGEKVHNLTNVLTLQKDIHEAFDRLHLYFESTPQKDHYEVKTVQSWKLNSQMHQFVTFSTMDPNRLPVPAAELLALHATCCKVAHFSGAAEHIDKAYRDADEMGVLASDGTSEDILSYTLSSLLSNTIRVHEPTPNEDLVPPSIPIHHAAA